MGARIVKLVDARGNGAGYQVVKGDEEVISAYYNSGAPPFKKASSGQKKADPKSSGAAVSGQIIFSDLKEAAWGEPEYDCPVCARMHNRPFWAETNRGKKRVIRCEKCDTLYRP